MHAKYLDILNTLLHFILVKYPTVTLEDASGECLHRSHSRPKSVRFLATLMCGLWVY